MQRSGSSTRVSEEVGHPHLLPTYDPLSDAARKEASRARSAESAVHAIPLILLLCALILWFFSSSQARMQ